MSSRNTACVTAEWCDWGRRSIRKGTPELLFAVQLIQQPSHHLAGEVSSSMSCSQSVVPGPCIHLPGLCSCGMPGPWGAVGGEDHAVIKSSLERKGGCKPCSFIWAL